MSVSAEDLVRRIEAMHGIRIPLERAAAILPIVRSIDDAVARAAADMAFEAEAATFARVLEEA